MEAQKQDIKQTPAGSSVGKTMDQSAEGESHKNESIVAEEYYLRVLHEMQEKISGLKKLAEQQAAEKSQIIANNNKFVSIISHDLRGPMSSILGVLSLLKEFLYDSDKQEMEEYIDIASASAINVSDLLENLLLWSTAQNAEVRIDRKELILAPLVDEVIVNSSLSALLKKLTITHTIQPEITICADAQMVKTIFRNLISNATKFTSVGGTITISVVDKGAFVEVSVRDNGKGMSEKEQREVFNMDPHHLKKQASQIKASGLGLMLCREFVELHGGEIIVESKPGKGSNFIFSLPKHY